MEFTQVAETWSGILGRFLQESHSVVLGVFNVEGDLIFANAGLRSLLAYAESGSQNMAGKFINPDFAELLASSPSEESKSVFSGEVTLEQDRAHTWSVPATIYRHHDEFLIVGEYNVAELHQYNTNLNEMNQEINNLQRELIKEKRNLETTLRQLKETQQMLIHAEKMNALGNLVAGVAHEINNPISYVKSNIRSLNESMQSIISAWSALENLASAQVPDQARTSVEEEISRIKEQHDLDFIFEDFPGLARSLEEGTDRVSGIVTDLRKFSRLDENERKLTDINENLGSTLSLVQSDFRNKGIELDYEPGDIPTIECYAGELNQVFLNIIVNAIQAMENGGTLRIRSHFADGNIYVTFQDTGSGIPEHIQAMIFNPFFTTKEPGKGTGLGLSIADRIVTDHHRGRITLESVVGAGSVFQVQLPLDPGDSEIV